MKKISVILTVLAVICLLFSAADLVTIVVKVLNADIIGGAGMPTVKYFFDRYGIGMVIKLALGVLLLILARVSKKR